MAAKPAASRIWRIIRWSAVGCFLVLVIGFSLMVRETPDERIVLPIKRTAPRPPIEETAPVQAAPPVPKSGCSISCPPGMECVSGYTKKNGRHVKAYCRHSRR
jgi:hypothetical protein